MSNATATETTTAPMIVLFNRQATRTGQLHTVYFIPREGGKVSILWDDCFMDTAETLPCEMGRAEYKRLISLGFQRADLRYCEAQERIERNMASANLHYPLDYNRG